MRSIREIYKIGRGPSSSHTIGPERAAKVFAEKYPDADHFEVRLYHSLCMTGKGHGTDRVLEKTFSPNPVDVIFCKEAPEDVSHPNTMDFLAYSNEKLLGTMRAMSIGGGDIRIDGIPENPADEIYPENSFAEVEEFCRFRNMDLAEYVILNEGEEILDFLSEIWNQMKKTINEGLAAEGVLPGGLNVERKAKLLFENSSPSEEPELKECRLISAYAYAVSEQNADNGIIMPQSHRKCD